MPIRTKKYISRGGRKVRAVKVTEKNYLELAKWASKAPNVRTSTNVEKILPSGDIVGHRVKLHLEHVGIRSVPVGDYLVLHVFEDGRVDKDLQVSRASLFNEKFAEDKA